MKRELCAVIFVLFCGFLVLIAGHALNDDDNTKLSRRSRQMLSFMNESVDPCENFYEFTCGKWSDIYPAQADYDMETNFFKLIVEAFDSKAIEMLQSKHDPEDLEFDKKVKNFYQSCVSLENGPDPQRIIKVLEEFGKMPALLEDSTQWDETSFDWIDTLANIQKNYGYEIIVGLDVDSDMKDNITNCVYIGQAEFELESKSIYLDPIGAQYMRLYKLTMAITMVKLLGMDMFEAMSVASDILRFERDLVKGMMETKAEKNFDKLIVKTTADELQQKYGPTIDVKRYLKTVFGEVPEGMIYEYVPGYLQNVREVIERANKRDVANYLFYHLMRRFRIEESKTQKQKEKNCLKMVKKQFYKALDNMFYRRFLDKQVEQGIVELWSEIKSTFKAKLLNTNNFNWMTAETRSKALEKLEELKLKINSYKDYDFREDFDNLTTSENDFVGNLQNITISQTRKSFGKLHKPATKLEMGYKASGMAVYFQAENTIYVPMSMLQPYFLWASNYPYALKYSFTGFMLAHELIHAFDESGHQFGKTGNMEEWWDSETIKRFSDLRNCFIDQYHGYVYGGKLLPKSETQSENIADNGGLQLAYEAYLSHLKGSNEQSTQSLPGFKYTDKQLFFIGYGQFWCSDIRDFLVNLLTATDTHTPGEFRNIGVLSNFEQFAEAFNCAVGSKMNPEKKCKIY